MNYFPRLPSGLRHLDFGKCFHSCEFTGASEENIRNAQLAELTSLLLPYAQIGLDSLRTLMEPSKGNIKILNLCSLPEVLTNQTMIQLLLDRDHCKSLVELDVSRNQLKDSFFEHIAQNCPRLQDLNASHDRSLTGVGVKALILKPGEKLKRLNLEHCDRVGIDAVELARANGIQVTYHFLHTWLAGRTVRTNY